MLCFFVICSLVFHVALSGNCATAGDALCINEECECNGQATDCDLSTGKCVCTVKGTVGDRCQLCDTRNGYRGDPGNNEPCFYELQTDYQYTFNLSKKEDRKFTQIKYKNSPPKANADVNFAITCSAKAKMNVTVKTANKEERPLFTATDCTTYSSKFSKTEYDFGVDENVPFTTFYVYVYDFHPPLWIQLTFHQPSKLDFQQLYVTLSTLAGVAALDKTGTVVNSTLETLATLGAASFVANPSATTQGSLSVAGFEANSTSVTQSAVFSGNCTNVQCVNGECVNGTDCVCNDGWQGTSCQFCGGKVRLSDSYGTIHDGHSNYSIESTCSWLVDAGGVANTTIRLHFEEFATECGWDYLYIFDGDSVHSPLLAVFSGLMYKEGYSIRRIPEVVAHSGSALLHFYSDVAYNMTGFNITYRLNSCPSRFSHVNCSGHGVCIDGICACDAMYTGEGCDVAICPNNCTKENGVCNREKHRCDCKIGFKGDDCSQVPALGYWEVVIPKDFVPEGSASHSATVWRDSLYIIGGESYHRAKMIYLYDFNGSFWETPRMNSESIPGLRYSHSSVVFNDKLYMYGGVTSHGAICNELWEFDFSAKTWENITVRGMPLQSAGHTANLVTGKEERMVVIFGHSPIYGYLNTVQEYYFGTREWRTIEPRGYAVKGGFGHSSSWDPLTSMIYVYGGYSSESSSQLALSNKLLSYEPNTHMWRLLMPAPSVRFLHTATFLSPGLMIVFGGNTHNDSVHSRGAKCYSSELLAYDVVCDSWAPLPMPAELRADLARFGHSAVTFEDSLYVYGGFDGQMLADMLKFTPGQCSMLATQSACLGTRIGVKCVWDWQESKCQPVSFVNKVLLFDSMYRNSREIDSMFSRCPAQGSSSNAVEIVNNSMLCAKLKDCVSCVQTSYKCVWCGTTCSYENEKCGEKINETGSYLLSQRPTSNLDHCEDSVGPTCHQLHSCQACSSHPACNWDYEARCTDINNREHHDPVNRCSPSCASFRTCDTCTMEECIWCQNEARCVDKNSYTASFPYGQCREWTTHGSRCRVIVSGKSACSYYSTCGECRNDLGCGWCDDGSGTGLGTCLPGGNSGPDMPDYSCPAEQWLFTNCPACQCNGHSTCSNGTKICNQPCANFTHGLHCEHCITGYYGNPRNGGKCIPCKCNDQATECHPDTGKCFCKTKGIIGDHCERCDATNHFHGDPTNKGSCFYDLTIDYQFTFNLSKKEDRHFTQINFKNSPPKPDVDADISITCSVTAKMNITIKTANNEEKPLLIGHNCSAFHSRFSKEEYNFGVEENNALTTFYVHVYDFHPPLWIKISFMQSPKLKLKQFFISFSRWFVPLLLLVVVAVILWKIKQKYDIHRKQQLVEMEQMASRPFTQVPEGIEPCEATGVSEDLVPCK